MIIRNQIDLKPVFRALYEQAENLLQADKVLNLELSEVKKKRNNAQNNYYWLMNTEVADFLNESGLTYGEYELPYNSGIVHDIQKKIFGIVTTTKMTVSEFCDYETKVIHFWQEKTNWEFMPSELPISYLERKGYTDDYMHR